MTTLETPPCIEGLPLEFLFEWNKLQNLYNFFRKLTRVILVSFLANILKHSASIFKKVKKLNSSISSPLTVFRLADPLNKI